MFKTGKQAYQNVPRRQETSECEMGSNPFPLSADREFSFTDKKLARMGYNFGVGGVY
jgi:hypothetical protein